MHKKNRVRFLLSWVMIGILVTGMSGCSRKKAPSDADVSSGEAADDSLFALQGHNEDAASNLGAWGRAMGSVLIAMNDGSPYYFGGYAVSDANQKAAANILKESWGITSRRTLLKQINELVQTGSRKEYKKEAKEMNALSPKKLKKAMGQLSGDLLLHYQLVRRNWERWGDRGLLAWDMCRISHLVQWGYISGYLDDREAQAVLEPAARELQEKFNNWDDVVMNWLDGYALAAVVDPEKPGNDYEARKKIYESLVQEQKEKGILYDDSLFTSDIIPLPDVSGSKILGEAGKEKKKTQAKKKQQKKENKAKQQETEREDNEE